MATQKKPQKISDLLDEKGKAAFLVDLFTQFETLGLAVLSKADFEAYLYYLLKKHKMKDVHLGKFDWVSLLKVTPTKLNSMQTASAVKFEKTEDNKEEIIEALVRELAKNEIEIYDKDRQRLILYISDIQLKLFVEKYASENGLAISYKRNPNELIIHYSLLLQLLDEIEKQYGKGYKLREALQKQLKLEDSHNDLQEILKVKKSFTEHFAEEVKKNVKKETIAATIKVLAQVIVNYIQLHV